MFKILQMIRHIHFMILRLTRSITFLFLTNKPEMKRNVTSEKFAAFLYQNPWITISVTKAKTVTNHTRLHYHSHSNTHHLNSQLKKSTHNNQQFDFLLREVLLVNV